MASRALVAAVFVCWCGSGAFAQDLAPITLAPDEPAASVKAGKVLHALQSADTPPRIDGHLDDEDDADAFAGGLDYTLRWNRNRDQCWLGR